MHELGYDLNGVSTWTVSQINRVGKIWGMTDTRATHSFISLDCAKRLKLEISDINRSMVIDTPALTSVTTSFACLSCPIDIFGREFGMELVCLTLEQLDFILGMNWLELNRVHLN